MVVRTKGHNKRNRGGREKSKKEVDIGKGIFGNINEQREGNCKNK